MGVLFPPRRVAPASQVVSRTTRTLMRLALVGLMLAAFRGQPSRAAAPAPNDRTYAAEAEAAFKDGDFARAAERFAEAFKVAPKAVYLLKEGRSHARNGALGDATRAFETLVERFPNDPLAAEAIEALIEVRAGRVVIAVRTLPEGAWANLRDDLGTGCTTPCELTTDPGDVVVAVTLGEARTEQSRFLADGERWDISLNLSTPGATTGRRVGAWVAWGFAGAALVTGTAFGLATQDAYGEAEALADQGELGEAEYRRFVTLQRRARSHGIAADVGFAAAVAGAVVGTVLWFTSSDGGPGGAQWRF